MRVRGKFFILTLAVLLAAGSLMAQTTRGGLQGTVVDEGNQPLPGVTAVITSPAMQGSKTAVTDASGKFRFALLPPGVYKAVFSLPGYQKVENENIRIAVAQTITLEVTLNSAFKEEVLVTSEAPVVDTTSTTVGTNLGQEMIADLPTGRTFQSLTFLAAGAVDGGIAGNASIMGSSSAENRYVVDELDTTDPAFGTSGTNVSFNFIQEVQVQTGGYEPEYGGALGGVINMITKSGSNEFHGEAFMYYTDDSFSTEAKRPAGSGAVVDSYTDWDAGFDIGGKIIQDKLWYFVAYNPNFTDQNVVRDITYLSGGLYQTNTMTPKTTRQYYAGKFTWQVNENNSLTATVIGDPNKTENDYYTSNFVTTTYMPTDQTYADHNRGGTNYGVTWNSVLNEDMILELKYGRHESSNDYLANNGDLPTGLDYYNVWTPAVGPTYFGGPGFVQPLGDRSRDQARASFTWFLGDSHEIKIGAQWNWNKFHDIAHVSGYSDAVCVPLADDFWGSNDANFDSRFPACTTSNGLAGVEIGPKYSRYVYNPSWWRDYYDSNYKQDSEGETDESALYLQDSWKVTDYFTLKLGVRADAANVTGARSNLTIGPGLSQGIKLSFQDQIQPRVGFTWDYAHNGRSKLFAHYGKFYESIPLDINVRAFGNESYDMYYYWYPDSGLPSRGEGGILPVNPGYLKYHLLLGGGTAADNSLGGQYLEEYVLGTEYEVMTNLAVGVKGIYRRLGQVIEDISVDDADTYFITNPGGCYDVNPVTGEELDPPTCFPYPSRIYRGVELSVNKRFSDNWQMYASLLWSRNKGNYGGLFRQDNGQLDPNITSLYDLPSLLKGAYGLLPNDRKWQFKAFGSYKWDFGLVTGVNFSWMSGVPISRLGSHEIYGGDERFIGNRGEWGRTPTLMDMDLHLAYPFKMGDFDLELMLDVFHVFNMQQITSVDETYSYCYSDEEDASDPTCLNSRWGNATAYQSPRNYRLGIKFSF